MGLTIPHRKNKPVMKHIHDPRTSKNSLDKRPKRQNIDMRFGTWNIRSLYRAGSLVSVSKELSKHKLDLVGVQEIRWVGSGTKPSGEYTSFYGKGNENYELGTGSLCVRESCQQLRVKQLSLLVTGSRT
jgi:hypothetical protein